MDEQPDHPTEHPDASEAAAPPPSEALQGYPPEAAPDTDDTTRPAVVPGEQTDPDRRRDVFPEDGPGAGPPA